MDSSSGLVLANDIMTELRNYVIKPVIANVFIKFYCPYVDDASPVVKYEDVNHIHNLLNRFDRNLQFTADVFDNKVLHFLDLEVAPGGILRKDTKTGLYVNFTSFVTW